MLQICPTCQWMIFDGKSFFGFPHECPPMWDVWYPENDSTRDDARKIRAMSPSAAAEEFANLLDVESGEYHIVGGDDITVIVMRTGEPEYQFNVIGESQPVYTATQIKPEPRKG